MLLLTSTHIRIRVTEGHLILKTSKTEICRWKVYFPRCKIVETTKVLLQNAYILNASTSMTVDNILIQNLVWKLQRKK